MLCLSFMLFGIAALRPGFGRAALSPLREGQTENGEGCERWRRREGVRAVAKAGGGASGGECGGEGGRGCERWRRREGLRAVAKAGGAVVRAVAKAGGGAWRCMEEHGGLPNFGGAWRSWQSKTLYGFRRPKNVFFSNFFLFIQCSRARRSFEVNTIGLLHICSTAAIGIRGRFGVKFSRDFVDEVDSVEEFVKVVA